MTVEILLVLVLISLNGVFAMSELARRQRLGEPRAVRDHENGALVT